MKQSFALLSIGLFFIISCHSNAGYPVVTTFAGSGAMGSANGFGRSASFSSVMGVAVDDSGNVYVADSHNNLIRKISATGLVTTLAGSGKEGSADGRADTASFFHPAGIAVDRQGNVYVADTHNSLIRKISPNGMVTTVAGRVVPTPRMAKDTQLRLDNPAGIAVDGRGTVYIADWGKDIIRKMDSSGKITTLAGDGAPGASDGQGTYASFYLPGGIAVDSAGNLFVCDTYNNMIRKISPTGLVTTLVGKKTKGSTNGTGRDASFWRPAGIAVDHAGNLFVADVGNNKIRKVTPTGVVTTYAGSGQPGSANGRDTTASFYKPYGVAVSLQGAVYVADYQNNLIRKINP
jgi:serine/threonine protein kinase, bacterial